MTDRPRRRHGVFAAASFLLLLLCCSSPALSLIPPPRQTLSGISADSTDPILLSARSEGAYLSPRDQAEPVNSTTEVALSTTRAAVGPLQQMTRKARAAITILTSLIAYLSVNSLIRTVKPAAFIWSEEDKEESRWIASSRYWLDRKACRWFGICGAAHFHPVHARFGHRKVVVDQLLDAAGEETAPWHSFWTSGSENPDEWSETERSLREIPDYVFEYAPLVHLFSSEQFWPCDIAEHLFHITPMLNYTPIQSQFDHVTLSDLDLLNQYQKGRNVFLTSNDDAEDRPSWMEGEKNIPEPDAGDQGDYYDDDYNGGDDDDDDLDESWADWEAQFNEDDLEDKVQWIDVSDSDPTNVPDILMQDERFRHELQKRYGGHNVQDHGPDSGGRSEAPAILVAIDKGNGIIDAFWFYFYSFNLGNVVFNVRFGNHVGDWEHCLVRFQHGKPKALFLSAHNGGSAYNYEAVEKIGQRPVIYSAIGTHAMYAMPGTHSYILPWGLLHDQTDRGPLWDPLLNSQSYTYDTVTETLRASTFTPHAPTEWFFFNGHWGDKFYPLGDRRQYRFAGQYHYVNGPLGPQHKHLDRGHVCQGPDEKPCVIKNWIGGRPERLHLEPLDPPEE